MLTEIELLEKIKELYETKQYQKGYNLIIKNEDVIEKKYYDIIEYKIRFLFMLEKYIDASIIIKEELSLPYIPADFEKFLIQINKEISFALNDKKGDNFSYDDLENIDKLDNNTLLAILPRLKRFNLNEYVRQIQNILLNSEISDIVKSLLIACLSDSKLDANLYVIKNEITIKFNPISVFDIREGKNFIFIESSLKRIINLQINIQQIVTKISTTYLLSLYPLEISNHECEILLVSSLILSYKMMNQKVILQDLERIYKEFPIEVQKMCEKLNILLESI